MALGLFINDGYTLKATIPGVPGLYPTVQITYRPAGANDRYEHMEAPAGRAKDVAASIIARQIQSVKIVGDDSQAVKLDADQCLQLHAGLFTAMFNHALGYAGPDVERMEKN